MVVGVVEGEDKEGTDIGAEVVREANTKRRSDGCLACYLSESFGPLEPEVV